MIDGTATFRIGDVTFPVKRMRIDGVEPISEPAPEGVRGFSRSEFTVQFDVMSDAQRELWELYGRPRGSVLIRCARCGQGRLYSLARIQRWHPFAPVGPIARWARHICPRGAR